MGKRTSYDIAEMTDNLVNAYQAVSPSTQEEGIRWYAEAHLFAEGLAEVSGFPLERIAGVIAVTSPLINWEQQKVMVPLLIKAFKDKVPPEQAGLCLISNTYKAYKCLEGNLNAIHGDKVTNFYQAIMGDQNAVTLDRHAVRPALGIVEKSDNDNQAVNTAGKYAQVKQAYVKAAKLCGMPPREFQAVLWVHVRNS